MPRPQAACAHTMGRQRGTQCRLLSSHGGVISGPGMASGLGLGRGHAGWLRSPLQSGQCGCGRLGVLERKIPGGRGCVCCGCPGIPDKASALGSRSSYQPGSESSRSPRFMVKSRWTGENTQCRSGPPGQA